MVIRFALFSRLRPQETYNHSDIGLLGERSTGKEVQVNVGITYTDFGDQIIAPHDEGISRAIKNNLEPAIQETQPVIASPLCIDPTEDMRQAYFKSLHSLISPRYLAISISTKLGSEHTQQVKTTKPNQIHKHIHAWRERLLCRPGIFHVRYRTVYPCSGTTVTGPRVSNCFFPKPRRKGFAPLPFTSHTSLILNCRGTGTSLIYLLAQS